MKPGRELDAMIAERVMHWKTFAGEPGYGRKPERLISLILDPIPHYSTEIAAAWFVVDAIHDLISNRASDGKRTDINFLQLAVLGWYEGVAVSFNPNNRLNWWEYTDRIPFSASGETAAHAICLASLKVVS